MSNILKSYLDYLNEGISKIPYSAPTVDDAQLGKQIGNDITKKYKEDPDLDPEDKEPDADWL
jgi:hypothetical protein